MSDASVSICGGIDVGGTKIEAGLYDRAFEPLQTGRRPTPVDSYESLVETLLDEITGLRRTANCPDLPIGIAFPGFIDSKTGQAMAANLPTDGRPLREDLRARAGGQVTIANDCQCFALSEANGGAADGIDRVFGLILGTGVGGGFCRLGSIDHGCNGIAGEVGHFGIPAHLAAKFDLPSLPCGCGRLACFETLISGPGMTRIGFARTAAYHEAEAICAGADAKEPSMVEIRDIWLQLTAELLHTIQLFLDPDCIVIGGGLSRIAGVADRLQDHLSRTRLARLHGPIIRLPRHGDSSGGRGAAILAATARSQAQ